MNDEKNQNQHSNQTDKVTTLDKKMKQSKWKQFFSKKWTFPALYMGAAALILALIIWYQDSNQFTLGKQDFTPGLEQVNQSQAETGDSTAADLTGQTQTPDAVPAAQIKEQMAWPASKDANVKVTMKFYDEEASQDVQEAALIRYENTFYPHTGIDIAAADGKTFDITAALSGKVIKAEKDPVVGNVVEIESTDNLITVYQSLEDVKVAVGDQVKQGDVIAKAGRNIFEKNQGVHLHFEVKENNVLVNPEKFLAQAAQPQ